MARRLDPEYDKEDATPLSEEELFYLGEKYKAQVLAAMSSEHLIDMIMTVPTVHLKPSMRDTGFTASYHFDPLTNLQYTRDQQITTAKVRVSVWLHTDGQLRGEGCRTRELGPRSSGSCSSMGRQEPEFRACCDEILSPSLNTRLGFREEAPYHGWGEPRRTSVALTTKGLPVWRCRRAS